MNEMAFLRDLAVVLTLAGVAALMRFRRRGARLA